MRLLMAIVRATIIGFLIMLSAFLYRMLAAEQGRSAQLRYNMAALCEVSIRPPQYLWLGEEK